MASVFKRERDKKVKGSKWSASWYDYERETWRHQLAYTDRGLSMALAQRLEHESASKREGFTSNVRDEMVKPIGPQVDEYITHLESKGDDSSYMSQLKARILRTLEASTATRLLDIDAGRVEKALLAMRTPPRV